MARIHGMRTRRSIESLETRACPAVMLTGGGAQDLFLTGDPEGALLIEQTADGEFTITDSGADPGDASDDTVLDGMTTRDLRVFLNGDDDEVTVDLGGFTTPDDVYLQLRSGANTLTVVNGAVGDDLGIWGRSDQDVVTLGGGAAPLSVGGDLYVNLDGDGGDLLTVESDVEVGDDARLYYINEIEFVATVDDGGTPEDETDDSLLRPVIADDLTIVGGTAGNEVALSAEVGDDAYLYGSRAEDDVFTLTDFSVGDDLVIRTDATGWSWRDRGDDIVELGPRVEVGDDLWVDTSGGDDAVTVDGSTTVGDRVYLLLGSGDDTLTLDPAGFAFGFGFFDGGRGDDTLDGDPLDAMVRRF